MHEPSVPTTKLKGTRGASARPRSPAGPVRSQIVQCSQNPARWAWCLKKPYPKGQTSFEFAPPTSAYASSQPYCLSWALPSTRPMTRQMKGLQVPPEPNTNRYFGQNQSFSSPIIPLSSQRNILSTILRSTQCKKVLVAFSILLTKCPQFATLTALLAILATDCSPRGWVFECDFS